MSPRISIVLPTYNGSAFLRESLDSIVCQTERDWELIMVNDASTDNTQEIADEYAGRDERIRSIRNPRNLRLPASLNVGLGNARGELLTWTSDDNIYRPEALQRMAAFLDENPGVDIVYTAFTRIDDHGRPFAEVKALPPSSLIKINCIGGCFLFRRHVFADLNGYNENLFMVEDYDFWLRAAEKFKIDRINKDLYFLRTHEKSLSISRQREILELRDKLIEKHLYSPHWTRFDRSGACISLAESAFIQNDFARSSRFWRRACLFHPLPALREATARVIANGLLGHVITLQMRAIYGWLRKFIH